MVAFADGELDVRMRGGFVEELVLGDEPREQFSQHLALGRGRFLDVKETIAVIDYHDDALAMELCFPYGV